MQLRSLLSDFARSRFNRDAATRLKQFRDHRVRGLIAHAYRHVPYYRELMKQHGIRPEDIRGTDDLAHFPISYKNDFQDRSIDIYIDQQCLPEQLILHRTSGSTGQPLRIQRSWWEERIYGAYRWDVMGEYGYRPIDRHAELEELQPRNNGDRRSVHSALQSIGLYRQRRIQALQSPRDIWQEIAGFKPDVLTGYTGVIARVAAEGPSSGIINDIRFIACHSDHLTGNMRQQISRAFGAPVFELYDSYEINVIAWQCPEHDVLHSADACAVVEVIRDGQPATAGEQGEVILTALHSFTMPFIRYAIGDIATRAPACECGRASSALRSIDGRTVEYFPLPDGRMIHPYEIYAVLDNTEWIRQYQVVQTELDSLQLDVVPACDIDQTLVERQRKNISQFVGAEVTVRINPVTQIGAQKGGKTPAFRSLVGNC
jgi:phenylacetate-CoA ligase